ncbi:ATP-binding protein [Hymenobacter canadensis]|uniref:histidine kinase n=1 Tax=Hymenobacter canadensis TaxID=2999067 RepID=A0ABY7LZ08_9BACT|nr:ATP-binding protein [Hymenobacter canadensis]WBA44010.1 ATP-binding protein [Hymenobacter canadensis]
MTAAFAPVPAVASPCCAALAAAELRIQALTAELAQARLVEQMLETLSDRLPEGLLLLDAAGNIVLATRNFFHLLGLPVEVAAWLGRPAGHLMAQMQPLLAAPLDLASWTAPDSQKLTTAHHELFRLHNGRVLAYDIRPAPTDAGPEGITLLTLRDVSEEQRLLAEQKLIFTVADQSPRPFVRIGANRQQLHANPAARRISKGLSRAEQVQVQRQLRAAVAEALTQTEGHEVEVMMGEQSWSVAVMPFPQEGYVNLYFADITERNAVRRELHEQQQFMQQVFDNIPTIVFVRDRQQKLIFQNRAMQHLVELSPVPPDPDNIDPNSQLGRELAAYAAVDRQVLETGEEISREEPFTLADGVVHWFYTTKRCLYRTDGTVQVLGVTTDITAMKRAQRTLERSEKKYHDLMFYGQALIGTCDLNGTVLSVNPALATLLRENADAMPGRHVTDHMLAEDRAVFGAYLVRMAARGEDKGVLRVRPRGSLDIRYVLYHNVVVREPNESYMISHGHDITDRILAEEETQRARLAAEAAVTARENFLANMSHEIRTPMNGVLGVANLLSKTALTPEQQEYLAIISRSGHHLLAVLNDVLDMAKIASGKLELDLEAFNLCDSMGHAVHPLALQAAEKGIRFEGKPLRESCPLPWVQGDAHRLNQILINLVSNAVKFTPAGGTVRVQGELLAETADALTVRFQVTDTGIGMKPEVLARIFESFTQAYADTSRRFGGTGLGLSISKALVEQMGGQLTAESTAGVGSCFTFVLTLAKAQNATSAAEPESFDTGALRGVRVLLVEDNDINRFVARRTMQEWGVVVTEAEDGHQGVEQFGRDDYDVVLMDIQMPGMSGLEATALLRAHADPARATVPILALTANAFRADHEHYLTAGMNDCLAKPFDEAQLYAKLLKLLRR